MLTNNLSWLLPDSVSDRFDMPFGSLFLLSLQFNNTGNGIFT